MKKLYIQIHRSNLADYISKAIILPTKYIENRTEEDIQSKNEDFILLSDGYFDELTDNQVLLEIALTDDEIKSLETISLTCDIEDKVYACRTALPITRIIHIHIANKDIINQYKSTFHIGDIGYLPNDRLKVLTKILTKKLKKYTLSSVIKNKTIKWSKISKTSKLYPYKTLLINSISIGERLLKYDKIMGLFAFIKNTNLYFANREKSISNYSNYYFTLLGQLNSKIEYEEIDTTKLNFFKALLGIEKSTIPLIIKVFTKEQIDNDFIKKIADNSKNKDILYRLFDEMEKMEALEELKKDSTDFYSAYLYVNRFDGDMESLKTKIKDIKEIKKVEILLAIFGLYYGYSKIRAREAIDIEDDIFKNLLIDNREKNIKFMLDSKLDYITIESIYQYIFNNKISNKEFDYLEYPKKYKNIKIKETETIYNQERIKYFDVDNIVITKKNWGEITRKILDDYPNRITLKTPNLLSYMFEKKINIYENSTTDNKLKQLSYKKEDIEEVIEKEKNEKERIKILEIFEKDGK